MNPNQGCHHAQGRSGRGDLPPNSKLYGSRRGSTGLEQPVYSRASSHRACAIYLIWIFLSRGGNQGLRSRLPVQLKSAEQTPARTHARPHAAASLQAQTRPLTQTQASSCTRLGHVARYNGQFARVGLTLLRTCPEGKEDQAEELGLCPFSEEKIWVWFSVLEKIL